MRDTSDTAGKSDSGFSQSYVIKITCRNMKPRGKAQSLKYFTQPAPHWFSAVAETIAHHKNSFPQINETGKLLVLGLDTKGQALFRLRLNYGWTYRDLRVILVFPDFSVFLLYNPQPHSVRITEWSISSTWA
jgi:hypothetical protein